MQGAIFLKPCANLTLVMGCIVGSMQLIMAPSSELYANVFETSAALLMSFLGMFRLYVSFLSIQRNHLPLVFIC